MERPTRKQWRNARGHYRRKKLKYANDSASSGIMHGRLFDVTRKRAPISDLTSSSFCLGFIQTRFALNVASAWSIVNLGIKDSKWTMPPLPLECDSD